MERTERDRVVGFTLGVVSGAAFGAGLALLLAPKSGSALRAGIADSMDAARKAIASRYADLATRASSEIDSLQGSVEAAADALEARGIAAVRSVTRQLRRAESRG